MHASIEQLLSLRDDVAVDAEVKTHVKGCKGCQTELDRLVSVRRELRSLPTIAPPAELWGRIEQRMTTDRTTAQNTGGHNGFRWVAAAAALAIAALLLSQTVGNRTPVTPVAVIEATVPDTVTGIDLLAERSQQLEIALGALGDQPSVVRARTAETIATLEDQLALVDYQLSYANAGLLPDSQSEALWRERVDLMNSLVQVRYAEVQRISY